MMRSGLFSVMLSGALLLSIGILNFDIYLGRAALGGIVYDNMRVGGG
jgi:hypothetical protein